MCLDSVFLMRDFCLKVLKKHCDSLCLSEDDDDDDNYDTYDDDKFRFLEKRWSWFLAVRTETCCVAAGLNLSFLRVHLPGLLLHVNVLTGRQ